MAEWGGKNINLITTHKTDMIIIRLTRETTIVYI